MNYYTFVTSNTFKVNNPVKFKEDFKNAFADDVNLKVSASGFKLHAFEERKVSTEKRNLRTIAEGNLKSLIQSFLQKESQLHMRIVILKGESLKRDAIISHTAFHLVTELGAESKQGSSFFEELSKQVFPKRAKCLASCFSKETGTWIESGKDYIVNREVKFHNRRSYEVFINDVRTLWGKEYFRDLTK